MNMTNFIMTTSFTIFKVNVHSSIVLFLRGGC